MRIILMHIAEAIKSAQIKFAPPFPMRTPDSLRNHIWHWWPMFEGLKKGYCQRDFGRKGFPKDENCGKQDRRDCFQPFCKRRAHERTTGSGDFPEFFLLAPFEAGAEVVDSAAALRLAANTDPGPDRTILIADGVCRLDDAHRARDGVTIGSRSGNRTAHLRGGIRHGSCARMPNQRNHGNQTMETILIIDDEAPILNMFRLFLGFYGYEVLTADNGEKGIEVFGKEKPPIVFIDLKMPGIDGFEVLRRIKEMVPETEAIVITGHGDEELEQKARSLRANDFIHKPFQQTALHEALERLRKRLDPAAP